MTPPQCVMWSRKASCGAVRWTGGGEGGRESRRLRRAARPGRAARCLGLGRVRRYRRGATIVLQGARDDTVCVVLQGRVKVTLDTPDGHEVVLSVLGPGDLLGEWEAITPSSSVVPLSEVALEPVECRVFYGRGPVSVPRRPPRRRAPAAAPDHSQLSH